MKHATELRVLAVRHAVGWKPGYPQKHWSIRHFSRPCRLYAKGLGTRSVSGNKPILAGVVLHNHVSVVNDLKHLCRLAVKDAYVAIARRTTFHFSKIRRRIIAAMFDCAFKLQRGLRTLANKGLFGFSRRIGKPRPAGQFVFCHWSRLPLDNPATLCRPESFCRRLQARFCIQQFAITLYIASLEIGRQPFRLWRVFSLRKDDEQGRSDDERGNGLHGYPQEFAPAHHCTTIGVRCKDFAATGVV